jgi:hypothetical protein
MSLSFQSSLQVAKQSKIDGYSTSLMVIKRLDLLSKVFPKLKA